MEKCHFLSKLFHVEHINSKELSRAYSHVNAIINSKIYEIIFGMD